MNKKKTGIRAEMAYGAADIYGGGAFVIISTFYTVFLTKALGMPVAMAGTIPLVGKVWDAVTDPIMGNITDRTKSRLGAKRFYILIGSVISAITFLLMWVPFYARSMGAMYIFYMAMYMLFSTGFTIVMVPYNALLPDMVEDYTQRSKFSGVRMILSSFGAIIAGLIPTIMIRDNTKAVQYFRMALVFSVIFFAVILITFLGTWEKQKEPVKVDLKESFVQSLTVYKSRSYRLFIAIFLCGQGSADFLTGLSIYYIDDVLNAYGGGRFTLMMGTLLLAQFAGTIIFTPLMAKTSKKFPLLCGFPIRIAATLALFFVSYEGVNFAIILGLSFLIGFGMSGSSTTIYAILADMADVDELITSINRPGTCSSMATFIRKICTGLASAVIGFMLMLIGYNEKLAAAGKRQPLPVRHGITAIYILAPVVLMVAAIIFTILFPMKKREFDVIKTEIKRRKGEDDSKASSEDIRIIEKVTGFAYDKLWNKDNALRFRRSRS